MVFAIRLHTNAVKFLKELDKVTGDRIKSALRVSRYLKIKKMMSEEKH